MRENIFWGTHEALANGGTGRAVGDDESTAPVERSVPAWRRRHGCAFPGAWNQRHAIGAKVRSTMADDDQLETRTQALVLFGHRAAVYLKGFKGYFDLDELTPA